MSACTKGLQEPITSQGQEDCENLLMGNSPCSLLPTINFLFPVCGQQDRISQRLKNRLTLSLCLSCKYILGYGACLMMSLMAEVLKKN